MPSQNLPIHLLLRVSLALLGGGPAMAAGLDLVTLKNGDIHNGTAALERYTMELPFGTISVPYGEMALLRFHAPGGGAVLSTRRGDRFVGQLKQREITMIRVLDTTLPLAVSDIAEIRFSPKVQRTSAGNWPDLVQTGDGSRFTARIGNREFLFRGEKGVSLLSRDEIQLMELAFHPDGEGQLVQVSNNGGGLQQGRLELASIRADTGYGSGLVIPLERVQRLGFRLHQGSDGINLHPRRRLRPTDLIQDRMRDGSLGPELVALPGGHFRRGDLKGDGDGDEQPPAEVKLAPFAIGIYEVTFEEYDRFCSDTGHSCPDDGGWGRVDRPVVNVSWEDAVAYTRWLSRRTGQRYRLPTDAEWEYSARAGSLSRYWWGDKLLPTRANCDGCGSIWDAEMSAPVGSFEPNPFGLHDTAGNVFEWVADCWHDSFAGAPSDGSAIQKPGCGKRVIRGGSWSFPVREIRSANRWRDFPARSSDDTGFRVVRELSDG